MQQYEAALPPGAWPNWVLGNHDTARIASRIGEAQARIAAMLLLTLRGTPTIYYGEEIGMKDVSIAPELVQDPAEKNQPGLGLGRDPERAPMPWDGSRRAGFTSGEPWLPLCPDHANVNVSALSKSPGSMLNLYRQLTKLRRDTPALIQGEIAEATVHANILKYQRCHGNRRLALALNFARESAQVLHSSGQILLSTYLDRTGEGVVQSLSLRANEGIIVQL